MTFDNLNLHGDHNAGQAGTKSRLLYLINRVPISGLRAWRFSFICSFVLCRVGTTIAVRISDIYDKRSNAILHCFTSRNADQKLPNSRLSNSRI